VHRIERAQVVPLSADDAFAFFADAHNLEAITPPWLRFRILTSRPIVMAEDTLIDYRLTLHRLPLRWRTRITRWQPGRLFVDIQVRGPFRLWEHTHTFERSGTETLIRDVVRYQLPLGPMGIVAHRTLVHRDLESIFDYRRDAVGRLLDGTRRPQEPPTHGPMPPTDAGSMWTIAPGGGSAIGGKTTSGPT
jgi:ligand-binding SRPBCC domain-containing protein